MAEASNGVDGQHGIDAEDETRTIAAQLGLADFVYKAEMVSRGGGNREPGDALIYANGLGAIIQVKSREPAAARTDSTARTQAWIAKHGKKAAGQADGTRRQLMLRRQTGDPVIAVPARAFHLPAEDQRRVGLTLDMDVSRWPTIVVLDHPLADAARAPLPADVFWITLDDWHGLHRAIRSTTGVLSYIQRVLTADPTPQWSLGTERLRYSAFVEADRQAASDAGSSIGYFDWTVLDDPIGVDIYRDVMQRLWPEGRELPSVQIDDYRLVLDHLDAVAPGAASNLGRWIHAKRKHLREHRSWASGMSLNDDRLTVYACDHRSNYTDIERFDAELAALLATRSHEIMAQGGRVVQACGIGVLQDEPGLDYRFVFMRPPAAVPAEVVLSVQQARGMYDASNRRVNELAEPGRSAPCPCGSGRKFKRCHGAP